MKLRRFAAALVALAMCAPASAAIPPVPVLPYIPRPCAPDPAPENVQRPASCQRILYRYGPLHVTPGDNLILFGPVTVDRPVGDGYIVRFKPDLTFIDGTVPSIDVIHLHHAVWFLNGTTPTFASGEEKTIFSLPEGYGMPLRAQDVFLLNYMLHDQQPQTYDVFITYEIDWIPSAGEGYGSIKPAQPHWLDVGGFNSFNPVYNTQQGYGSTPGECAFPRERCAAFDPYGNTSAQHLGGNGIGDVQGFPSGTVVWMMGHLHPGGLRDEVQVERGNELAPLFTSHAVYFDPNGPVSWDMAMQVTPPDFRVRVMPGDRLVLNSVYDTAHGSWYEGMGIVIAFVAEGETDGADPFSTRLDPNIGILTHGHLPEASHHGGPDGGPLPAATPVSTSQVTVGGFAYAPGDLNTGAGAATILPVVRAGNPLTFVNADAGASIFHSITACKAPCNGETGISYPLANGGKVFDSLELGFGPPSATAASNKASWTLQTSGFDKGTYTYFCRVHPFMRGEFEID